MIINDVVVGDVVIKEWMIWGGIVFIIVSISVITYCLYMHLKNKKLKLHNEEIERKRKVRLKVEREEESRRRVAYEKLQREKEVVAETYVEYGTDDLIKKERLEREEAMQVAKRLKMKTESVILYVKYSPSTKFIQSNPWVYPNVKMPKEACVVRSFREYSQLLRGYKEAEFESTLKEYFSSDFDVLGDVRLNTGDKTRAYEPDIALVDYKSGKNIRIDIEIDEPYAGVSRQGIHLEGEDDNRDYYFKDRGWIVIRFTEKQVHTEELACVSFIASVVKSINAAYVIPRKLSSLKIGSEKQWDLIQAQRWEKQRYRETYLHHDFNKTNLTPNKDVERGLSERELEEESEVERTILGEIEKTIYKGINKTYKSNRDDRIKFYPEEHIYEIDGVVSPSATTLISRFFATFDKYYWSEKKARGLGMTPFEVREMWSAKGKEASGEGTFLHEQIEKYYLEQEYSRPKEFSLFEEFVGDHAHLTPYRTEWRIFDEEYHIAGTIDFISESGTGYEMYDWKRSKKVVNSSGRIDDNNWGKFGIGNLSSLPDTNFNKYALQQSLYKYILEKNYGILISKMFLVIMHPNYDRYHKLEVPYLKKEVEYMLTCLN